MAETKQAASLMSIEKLKQKLGVSDAVFEGTKAANGWKSGRQVEEKKEFKEACEAFRKAPVDGSKKRQGGKGIMFGDVNVKVEDGNLGRSSSTGYRDINQNRHFQCGKQVTYPD